MNNKENWWKWGVPEKRKTLLMYPKLVHFLVGRFGHITNPTAVPYLQPNTNEGSLGHLKKVVEQEQPAIKLNTDYPTRLKKSIGNGYVDFLQLFKKEPFIVADAVLVPQNHAEVLAVLQMANRNKWIVLTYGGGTNVVGAFRMTNVMKPTVILDTSEMNKAISIDIENHTATFQTGIVGPKLENILNEKGFTMGHFPQSFEYSTLGGWIATRSAGQESSKYGKIDDMVISVKIATPQGTVDTQVYAADAEGINLKNLFLGSEGTLGVITEAKVKIYPMPVKKQWVVAVFGTFHQGKNALQSMTQSGLKPTIIRLSDENETEILSLISEKKRGALPYLKAIFGKGLLKYHRIEKINLMMLRFDGDWEEVEIRTQKALKTIHSHGGVPLGSTTGQHWEKNRFQLPYLRDDFWEKGFLLDTAETVVAWESAEVLRTKMREELLKSAAFGQERGILFAHLSHVYANAVTIYFTIITKKCPVDAQKQWEEIKTIVINTILEAGGALSHHHGVGIDHRKWYLAKTDKLTLAILNSVKNTVDPNGILNPNKLFHEPTAVTHKH